MIEIKDLLLKFDHLLLSKEIQREIVFDAISKITEIPIKKEEIKIKNGTIFLKIKPLYKNEIFIKKNEIFFELSKNLGKKAPQSFG